MVQAGLHDKALCVGMRPLPKNSGASFALYAGVPAAHKAKRRRPQPDEDKIYGEKCLVVCKCRLTAVVYVGRHPTTILRKG